MKPVYFGALTAIALCYTSALADTTPAAKTIPAWAKSPTRKAIAKLPRMDTN